MVVNDTGSIRWPPGAIRQSKEFAANATSVKAAMMTTFMDYLAGSCNYFKYKKDITMLFTFLIWFEVYIQLSYFIFKFSF
jgi:hypothetical protein